MNMWKDCKLLKGICPSCKKEYVIRLDKLQGDTHFHMAYAFVPQNASSLERMANAHKENILIGNSTSDFNGCPYCGKMRFNICSCGTLFCADGDGLAMCPGCHTTYDYRYRGDSFNLNSSAF